MVDGRPGAYKSKGFPGLLTLTLALQAATPSGAVTRQVTRLTASLNGQRQRPSP